MATTKAEQKKFFETIEDLVWQHDIEFTEAVLLYCSTKALEPAAVSKLINKKLKTHLTVEAEQRNLLKKKKKK